MLLSVNNLSISFSSSEEKSFSLKHLSFNLHKGECLGIVGESGSGKSITSLAIMGLLPASSARIDSGEIIYQKEDDKEIDLLQLSEDKFRKIKGNNISMIFQEPMTSLNPVLTCGYQVTEVLQLHLGLNKKQSRQRTIELFKEVDLPRPDDVFDSYPHQLSGGQKQRVMIAMAIACKPDILIADEPTTALDVCVQKTILDLLKDLQKKYEMSIIFISHDLGVIASIATRVLVLYKGEMVEEGSVERILNNPAKAYTKGLIACLPQLDKNPVRLPVIADFIDGQSKKKVSEKVKKKVSGDIPKEVLLEVKNLKTEFFGRKRLFSKSKSKVIAVNNVNLKVYKGETLGLVGESGCGKTTLGRTILQLIESSDGSIRYKGQDLKLLSKRRIKNLRKQIQIIFQDPFSSLNPKMSIGESIMEPLLAHKICKNRQQARIRVNELLELVGLESSFFKRYPHEFSGGQRQRIGIARALAVEPEFIICDESVSALDVSVQAQVLNLLNDLKEQFGLTFIFISHDLAVVKYMSDRIIVMRDGEIVEEAISDELFFNPSTEYTRTLLNSILNLSN